MDYYERVVDLIKENRQLILEAWGRGELTTESTDGTVQLNAKWIGKIEALDEVLDMLKEVKQEYDADED